MLSGFERILTYSKGIKQHRALRHYFGDRLHFAHLNSSRNSCIIGWGNKRNTMRARRVAAGKKIPYFSIEDGFIRSIELGANGAPAFSFVIDDVGIYYDATRPSRLEKILQEHDFENDKELMAKASQAIELIRRFRISKYNIGETDLKTDISNNNRRKILVIAQTAGDMSLEYGFGNRFSTNDLITAANEENPDAEIYIKIHPDVLTGKKDSDIHPDNIPSFCKVISRDINPFTLLESIDKVYTKTSQMGFEALLLGKECVCFGLPFYAGWGLTTDRLECTRRKRQLTVNQVFAGAYLLYAHYYNPYLNKISDIIDTLYTIKRYREIEKINSSSLLFYGFTPWKRLYHRHFFKSSRHNSITFCKTPEQIAKQSDKGNTRLFTWSMPDDPALQKYLESSTIPAYCVEDGFIRSVALGSYLTMPYSLVVDARGLYIDPSRESDLEHIFNTYDFEGHSGLLERAQKVTNFIVNAKLSKYNNAAHGDITINRRNHDKVLLIPGQVADDASIKLAGYGMDNLSLIKMVRKNNPDSYLIYKPHPDVVAGNRNGSLPEDMVKHYCNIIVSDMSIDSCIGIADEIHTISSLSGFDAILRNKKVSTYGMPFYAGWGLTEDLRICNRRTRSLSRDQLVAGALLLYPRYVHPSTKELCEIEPVLEEILKEQQRLASSTLYRKGREIRNSAIAVSKKLFVKTNTTNVH